VKTLLCDFCLRSGMLCAKCQKLVQSGSITSQYMEVGKLLLALEKEYPALHEVTLHNAFQEGGILVLVVGRGESERLLSYGGRLTRALGDKFRGKRVKVLEKGVSSRHFLEDLFSGMTILTINTIWLPDGTTETKVVLKGKGRQQLGSKRTKALVQIAKKVGNINLRIEFV